MNVRLMNITLATALAAFSYPALGQVQDAGRMKPDIALLAITKHKVLHLPRPTDYNDFASMEDWIGANYGPYLVLGSFEHGFENGAAVTSFITSSDDGVYDHHTLSEGSDGGFLLRTTADLNYPAEQGDILTTAAALAHDGFDNNASASRTADSCSSKYACNCTLYARCLVPSLPSPATYYTEKVKAINWPYPNLPWYGYVAVMNISPPYGHLGIVNALGRDANWNVIVSLNEANYRACQVTYTRNGTPANLRIAGYYRP